MSAATVQGVKPAGGAAASPEPPASRPDPAHQPLYPRLLRLRHIEPNAWQRALLGEGAVGVAGLACLADLASLWLLPTLPLAVAAVVKAHDVVTGRLLLRFPDEW